MSIVHGRIPFFFTSRMECGAFHPLHCRHEFSAANKYLWKLSSNDFLFHVEDTRSNLDVSYFAFCTYYDLAYISIYLDFGKKCDDGFHPPNVKSALIETIKMWNWMYRVAAGRDSGAFHYNATKKVGPPKTVFGQTSCGMNFPPHIGQGDDSRCRLF